jgi:hypothetical protein
MHAGGFEWMTDCASRCGWVRLAHLRKICKIPYIFFGGEPTDENLDFHMFNGNLPFGMLDGNLPSNVFDGNLPSNVFDGNILSVVLCVFDGNILTVLRQYVILLIVTVYHTDVVISVIHWLPQGSVIHCHGSQCDTLS